MTMDNDLRGQDWAQARLDNSTPICFPETWASDDRTVAGDFIAKTVLRITSNAPSAAFTFENAVIVGLLELQSAEVQSEICFRKCTFIGPVSMREVTFAHRLRFIECVFQDEVSFAACRTSDLWFTAELELSRVTPNQPGAVFNRAVHFLDSKITGNLCLDNAFFNGDEPSSFNGAIVDGSVLIRGAKFRGTADFLAIRVGYSFSGDGSHFTNINQSADFSSAQIANSLSLRDSVFKGPAAFSNVDIGTNLACTRTQFLSQEETTSFNSMTVKGHALFDEAVFNNHVDLVAAKVYGSLAFTKAEFCGAEASATFNSAEISGHAHFSETIFHGSVDFGVTKVNGTFDFRKAQVLSEKRLAEFSGLKVGNHALFGEATFRGPVNFSNAQFDADLNAGKAQFLNADEIANFSTAAIKGIATFAETVFHGPVTFAFTEFDGLFYLQSAQFLSDKAAVNLQAIRVRNMVWLADAKFHGAVSLALAEIGGGLRCERTEFFNPSLPVEASAVKVKGQMSFANAKFHGPVDFRLIEVDGHLTCGGVEFLGPDAVVAFDSCIIRGAADFSKAIFHGPTGFTAMRITGHANFNSADFRSRTNFNSAKIENWVLFNGAHFGDAADFPFLNVGAAAEFSGALFKGPVKFTWSRVGGNLIFSAASSEKEARAAIFEGSMDLTGTSVGGEALFDRLVCRGTSAFARMMIRGNVGLNGADFHAGSSFSWFHTDGIASFNAVKFHGEANLEHFAAIDAYFTLALFEHAADFSGLCLKGFGYFTGAKFMAATSFRDGVVEGDLRFEAAAGDPSSGEIPVVFQGPFNADGIHVKGELTFSGCSFVTDARLTILNGIIGILNCQQTQFDQFECFAAEFAAGLLFISNVVNGDAGLSCLKVNGRAVFNGSVFKRSFDLSEAVLTGGAYFNVPEAEKDSTPTSCTFEGVAKFDRSRFSGPVEFIETAFQRDTSFVATQFLSEVRFARAQFSGAGRFSKTEFQNRVSFDKVHFKDRSDGSAVFAEADFHSQVFFLNTTVEGRLAFYGAKSLHTLGIETSCRFNGAVDFRNAKLSVLKIQNDGPTILDMSFLGTLRLNGCTYQRIECPAYLGLEALWAAISISFEGKSGRRTSPDFDRQPYLQFERFCREVGKNKLADQVYFELRRDEEECESRRSRQLWSVFERLVFGYGVRPFRMLCWFLAVLLGGAIVFSLPTSVKTAPAHFLSGLAISLGNLMPGLRAVMGSVEPVSRHRVGIVVAIFQYCFGWALLALLAHRFFKGLER